MIDYIGGGDAIGGGGDFRPSERYTGDMLAAILRRLARIEAFVAQTGPIPKTACVHVWRLTGISGGGGAPTVESYECRCGARRTISVQEPR